MIDTEKEATLRINDELSRILVREGWTEQRLSWMLGWVVGGLVGLGLTDERIQRLTTIATEGARIARSKLPCR